MSRACLGCLLDNALAVVLITVAFASAMALLIPATRLEKVVRWSFRALFGRTRMENYSPTCKAPSPWSLTLPKQISMECPISLRLQKAGRPGQRAPNATNTSTHHWAKTCAGEMILFIPSWLQMLANLCEVG